MCISTAGKRLIVVLGMHRSGTSAVTRGLQALGVGLGDHLMPPAPCNERGFWEDLDVCRLNVALLSHLRRDWDSLEPIDGLTARRLFLFRRQARRLLQRKLAGPALFGLKDPRLARLLPFWKEVFAGLGLEVDYVIVLRHPLSVAASLWRRDGFSREKSLRLWMAHMLPALTESEGARRLVVSYDRLMASPEAELERTARRLDLPAAGRREAVEDYVRHFLSDDLRHSRFAAEDLAVAPDLPARLPAAYGLLRRLAEDALDIDGGTVRQSFRCWRHELEKSDGAGLAWSDGPAADRGQRHLLLLRVLRGLSAGLTTSPQ